MVILASCLHLQKGPLQPGWCGSVVEDQPMNLEITVPFSVWQV